MKQATLADVGKKANVSTSLASLVLSGKYQGRCTPETADEVRRAALELGYRANRLARGLRKQSTRVLGLLSIEVATTPYAGAMIMAAQQVARAKDYDLLFVEVENTEESIASGFGLMAEHQAEGVMIFSYFHHAINLPQRRPVHIVCANCFDSEGLYDCFIPDESKSFTQVLDEIGLAGHKHVALVTDASGYPAAINRLAAFKQAQRNYNWLVSKDMIVKTMTTTAVSGYEATHQLLHSHPEITALVAFNDLLAMGAYQAAKELQLQIPEDLSIAGFDDLELISAGLRPGLTTVRLPHFEMGKLAVERLIEICEADSESPRKKVEIICDLVKRESIGSPRLTPLVFDGSSREKPKKRKGNDS
jgi:LacI family transcriptional regulator